jgi:hypothetical protein
MFGPSLIAAVLFYAFVPGVLVTLPKGGSPKTVLVVHALLFTLVTGVVMRFYKSHFEFFGNHGASCPSTHRMLADETCQAIGGEGGKIYGPPPKIK